MNKCEWADEAKFNHLCYLVLPLFENLAALEQGKAIHESINRSEFCSDAFVGCSLVEMCVKCGSIKDAHNVFDKITK